MGAGTNPDAGADEVRSGAAQGRGRRLPAGRRGCSLAAACAPPCPLCSAPLLPPSLIMHTSHTTTHLTSHSAMPHPRCHSPPPHARIPHTTVHQHPPLAATPRAAPTPHTPTAPDIPQRHAVVAVVNEVHHGRHRQRQRHQRKHDAVGARAHQLLACRRGGARAWEGEREARALEAARRRAATGPEAMRGGSCRGGGLGATPRPPAAQLPSFSTARPLQPRGDTGTISTTPLAPRRTVGAQEGQAGVCDGKDEQDGQHDDG